MMKALVTEEQAKAIEFLRGAYTDGEIMTMYVEDTLGYIEMRHGRDVGCLYNLDALGLATALINGYEVEKTPEEKIKEYYEEALKCHRESKYEWDVESMQYHSGRIDGVRKTLTILGVDIEGVNV
ncbi:hypothetical protein MAWWA_69 [Bacillus phage vB_BspH_Mawwa]|nr:hypothetical protein MAWWA_69 [Bacillus phage vB_BspH_Mawwa]